MTHWFITFLSDSEPDINQHGAYGRTPLHEAADKGYKNIVRQLLYKEACTTERDDNDCTPYDLAYNCQHKEVWISRPCIVIVYPECINNVCRTGLSNRLAGKKCDNNVYSITCASTALSQPHISCSFKCIYIIPQDSCVLLLQNDVVRCYIHRITYTFYQVMQLLQQIMPEAVRPYAFLHSNTSVPLAVNALTFQGTGTMISGFKSSSVSKLYFIILMLMHNT